MDQKPGTLLRKIFNFAHTVKLIWSQVNYSTHLTKKFFHCLPEKKSNQAWMVEKGTLKKFFTVHKPLLDKMLRAQQKSKSRQLIARTENSSTFLKELDSISLLNSSTEPIGAQWKNWNTLETEYCMMKAAKWCSTYFAAKM